MGRSEATSRQSLSVPHRVRFSRERWPLTKLFEGGKSSALPTTEASSPGEAIKSAAETTAANVTVEMKARRKRMLSWEVTTKKGGRPGVRRAKRLGLAAKGVWASSSELGEKDVEKRGRERASTASKGHRA